MQIIVDGAKRNVAPGSTLADVLASFSPFGGEPTVARLNGVPYKSVDAPEVIVLHDGDAVDIYPLIIGG